MPASTPPWPPARPACPGRGCAATAAPWRCTPRRWPASRRSSTCTSPWPGWWPTGRPPPAGLTPTPAAGSRPACRARSRARSPTSAWSCCGGAAAVRAVATSAELRAATEAARGGGTEVGFVPTMGALHAGHRSLVARARRETGFVVVSVFVNPLQFGPSEDLATYPRDREGDLAALRADGADLAFLPSEEELWPVPPGGRTGWRCPPATPTCRPASGSAPPPCPGGSWRGWTPSGRASATPPRSRPAPPRGRGPPPAG